MFICCYWFFISDNNLKTDAYYLDNNGNIVSNNLLDIPNKNYTTKNGITYNVQNGVININGTVNSNSFPELFDSGLYFTLSVGTYTISKTSNNSNLFMWLGTDSQNNIVNTSDMSYTFTINSDLQVRFNLVALPNTNFDNFNISIMLNSGSSALSYEPYGIWYSESNLQVDYPDNYFNYIIGNNYFNNSVYTFNQRQTNFDGTLKVASEPLNVNNLNIDGNNLNSSSSFNYLFNNAMSLDVNNLTYIHVYNDINYSTSNFTYVSYFPHYNLPSNERSGLAMPLKYFNMSIDGSNYNGLIRLSCKAVGDNTIYQYINIEKDVNNMYVINFPTSDLFLISIDIQAVYSNGSYNFPTFIQSNVNQVESVSDFNLGYETAKSEFENALHTSEEINAQLQQERDNIYSQYRDLVDRYNQALYGDNALSGMILAIVDAPINIFKNIFDFEILGINIVGVVFGIITLLLIIWLIKKLL